MHSAPRMLVAMDDDLRVTDDIALPRAELSWRFSRSGGPGGQSVNTADSRVELSWDVEASAALSPMLRARALERLAPPLVDGVLTIAASEHRSQLRNREAAMARLADTVRSAVAPPGPPRKRTRPSAGARERRLSEKRHRGNVKK